MGTRERRFEDVRQQQPQDDASEGQGVNPARSRIAGLQQNVRDLLDLSRRLVDDAVSDNCEVYLDSNVQEGGQ